MNIHEKYEVIEERRIEDIHSLCYLLRHKKSGARLVVISNDDDNKVFSIGFRTTPKENTGVPHILEHSVLCGSTRFPVKDPFIELAKGSLNTYLNAMTYPDKTLYPIASYNEKDFKNLMHIYLDAVFYPKVLEKKEAFLQEGWHYELENEEAELEINGVVYNEMKGAYSSVDEILNTKVMNTLFPDNTYGYDSGGNPDEITDLTYEHYLQFYRTYYHPSNSYIYLYGDMDVEERLEWLDKEYLSKFDRIDVNTDIELQAPFGKMADVTVYAPISEEEEETESGVLSYSKVVDTLLDDKLYYAFDALDYALGSVPGAPVRQALLDAGIGQDVYSAFNCDTRQPYFEFTAKNTDPSLKTRFVQIIEDTLRKVVEEGIDKKALLAGLNSAEFRFREADYGYHPRGLVYYLTVMNSWLYDENQPFLHLECLKTFSYLKEMVETDYYEKLIQTYLLDNQHGAVVTVAGDKKLLAEKERQLKEKLKDIKKSMTKEEIQRVFEEMELLQKYQDTEDSKEALATIPVLKREDMRKQSLPFSNREYEVEKVKMVCHDYDSNGIDYLTLMFDVNDFSKEELPYLGLLRGTLASVDTKNYSYKDLVNEINIVTGGITASICAYPLLNQNGQVDARFEVKMKNLSSTSEASMALLEEVIFSSDFSDERRIAEIISTAKSRLMDILSSAGHITASTRALAGTSLVNYYKEATSGVDYFRFICEMDKLMKKNPKEVICRIEETARKVLSADRLVISYTNTASEFERMKEGMASFVKKMNADKTERKKAIIPLTSQREAFTDASQILYVARTGNFLQHGYAYTGALRVLRVILGYDYLWMNIRMKGGAYGCMNSFSRTGDTYFVSYRDPNLVKTNEIYDKIPEYLENFDVSEETMDKYVVGTFGTLDTPLSADAKGNRSMSAYMENLTYEEVQKERDEILAVTGEDIRNLKGLVQSVLDENIYCVVGNESIIKENRAGFDKVLGLYE